MDKLIEYGKSLGYDLRVIPNYAYLGYDKNLDSLSNISRANSPFIVRVLTSFNIQVRTGQLDQGGYWKNISRLIYSHGNFMISATGSGSFKKIRRKIHSYLLKDNFRGVNISGVVPQFDLGKYSKYNLDLLVDSYSVDIRLVKLDLSINSKKIPLEFTYDIASIKRNGNDSDQIEWFEIEVDLINSPHKNQLSIHIPNLLEIGPEGWIRDKKLEKLLSENNI